MELKPGGSKHGFGARQPWVQVLPLSLASCGVVGKLHSPFSLFSFTLKCPLRLPLATCDYV